MVVKSSSSSSSSSDRSLPRLPLTAKWGTEYNEVGMGSIEE
jgi:hypothetical protein